MDDSDSTYVDDVFHCSDPKLKEEARTTLNLEQKRWANEREVWHVLFWNIVVDGILY